MSRGRAIAVVLMLFAAAAIARAAVQAPPLSSRSNLSALPYTIDEWTGAEGAPIDAETLRHPVGRLGPQPDVHGGDGGPVGLYVAYYAKQRPGVSIHSPLHCLPGTGWEAVDVSTLNMTAEGAGLRRHPADDRPQEPAARARALLVCAPRPHDRQRNRKQGVAARRQRCACTAATRRSFASSCRLTARSPPPTSEASRLHATWRHPSTKSCTDNTRGGCARPRPSASPASGTNSRFAAAPAGLEQFSVRCSGVLGSWALVSWSVLGPKSLVHRGDQRTGPRTGQDQGRTRTKNHAPRTDSRWRQRYTETKTAIKACATTVFVTDRVPVSPRV